MDSSFDYNSPSVPDTAVADVVKAIVNNGKLPPLTDEEKTQRCIDNQIHLAQCRERDEERRAEYLEHQALEAAAVEHERRVTAAAAREKARQDYIARQERQRDQQISQLHYRARQAELWQSNVDAAAYNNVQQRYRQTLMGELDAMINPPQPPEPVEVIEPDPLGSPNFFDDDYNANYYADKFAGKFKR
jgi:hypothetical protein